MAKMTGLGKGLDALFGPVEEEIQENDVLKNLNINEVEPNRLQPRKNFNQEALEELAESIKKYGVIQPIIVTLKDVEKVNKDGIQKMGAQGIVEIDNQLKIIVGEEAKQLKKYIDELK